MIALSHKASRLLESLRAHVESRAGDWGVVYPDNAKPADFSPHQLWWHLSSLSHAGLYRAVDGCAWGEVKLTETKPEPRIVCGYSGGGMGFSKCTREKGHDGAHRCSAADRRP